MNQPVKLAVSLVMVLVGFLAMYTILNAGSPNSFLRPYVSDTRYDIYIALGSSLTVFILGFLIFYSRDREGFQQIIQINSKRIKELRGAGKKDDEIADAILAAMGSRPGYRHHMARKKLEAYLAEFT